ELVTMVNVALGRLPVSICQIADNDGDQAVSIAEIVSAQGYAQQGCPDTPGYCGQCDCRFVHGGAMLTLRGAVPSCVQPCRLWCAHQNGCEGVVSAACVDADEPEPTLAIP